MPEAKIDIEQDRRQYLDSAGAALDEAQIPHERAIHDIT